MRFTYTPLLNPDLARHLQVIVLQAAGSSLKLSSEYITIPLKICSFSCFCLFGFDSNFEGLSVLLTWDEKTAPSPSKTCPVLPLDCTLILRHSSCPSSTWHQYYTSFLTGVSVPSHFPNHLHISLKYLIPSLFHDHFSLPQLKPVWSIKIIQSGSSQFLATKAFSVQLCPENHIGTNSRATPSVPLFLL